MTFQRIHRVGTFRRFLVVGALATSTATIVALPLSAHAAPAGVRPAGRVVEDDPVAAQATYALATLQRAVDNHDASTMRAFDLARDRIAADIANRLMVSPSVMQAAWQRADREHQQAILGALSQLGVPYRRNTSKPGEGFDCSGLTTYAWSHAGFLLQRQSSAQIRAAAPRDAMTAQAGDLVQYPGHIMIWLGVERYIVHAPYSGRTVEVDDFSARRHVRYGDPTG